MQTASYKTYQGPGRISISRSAPRGTPAGYRIFKALAPTQPMMKMGFEQYEEQFKRYILGPLDPKETWNKLHLLTSGVPPVLLCWEKPPFTATNWCHRRMVAAWFEENLGVSVPEYHSMIDPSAPDRIQDQIFIRTRSDAIHRHTEMIPEDSG